MSVCIVVSDDDMISLASLMSYEGEAKEDSDIGNLADFEGLDLQSHTESFASFTAQMGAFLGKRFYQYQY